MQRRAPVLLTMASYHGTLAAARFLGAAGVPVTVADPELLAVARWSRFVSRRLRCPRVHDHDAFLEWLLRFGEREPGHVLYPTSDDVAWLYAVHQPELSRYFRMDQPPPEAIYRLLNKRQLAEACAAAGLDTPRFWWSPDGLDPVEREIQYPVVVKPQTQVLLWPHAKGLIAGSQQELRAQVRRLTEDTRISPALLAWDRTARAPLLQAYFPAAAGSIYNLSGFCSRGAESFVVRASRKVLQYPPELGIGLCFEAAEVDGVLADRLRTLCRQVGYHGVFEVEFVESGGRQLLIDFNPRFYGQMQFDIDRGLPLPMLAYLTALQDRDGVEALLAGIEADRPGPEAYSNRLEFTFHLLFQRLAGRMAASDARSWRRWYRDRRGRLSYAILNRRDLRPAVAYVAWQLWQYARHPRSLMREFS